MIIFTKFHEDMTKNHFYKIKKSCLRKMILLKPGYAISIHSSQGVTLESVIVNLGNREFATGVTYLAPTGVQRIENLTLCQVFLD